MTDYRESVTPERVRAVSAFGFTERQARFLVTVMLHAGVFVERQYCAFAGISHGQKTHDFLVRLVGRRYATAITPGRLHRGRLFHVHYRPLYAAIDEPDNRHRKHRSLGRMVERLMILDAVLADGDYTWLATEHDKIAYFTLSLGTRLQRHEYPHLAFGEGAKKVVRYFPDKLPIGVDRNGGRRHLFVYLVTDDVPVDFRMFLLRHGELLRAVPEWTIRLLVPGPLRRAVPLYERALREELANPLSPATVEELRWFFRERGKAAQAGPSPADSRFREARRAFGAPRFRGLYRAWQQHGDPVLWAAQSPVLRDRLARDEGRVEIVCLSRQYLHLSPLVATA